MALSFTQALEHAARLATQSLPETLHERISAAVSLVRDGHCFQLDDGTWAVASATTEGKRYAINGSGCSCEDAFYRAPEGKCKHKLAQLLARKTAALLSVAQTGEEPPAEKNNPDNYKDRFTQPLYEAPASINVKVQVHGYDCQLTLRDRDETRLLARLQAVLAQYPQPQPVPHPGQDVCPIHHVPMRATTKNGATWTSHRTRDGWCKGK